MPATAPTTAIGYAQAPNYNWWLYDNETTPELVWPQSIYVYDQMRRQDSQVYSVLRAVTETLLRTPWRIDPAGARARVVKFVADDLGLPVVGKPSAPPPRLKDRFSWTTHLREALLMLPFGHSYFEQLYRVSDDGSQAHLRKLEYRPAKTIERIDVAPDGGLIAIKQYWTATNTTPKPIPVNRLVAYIHAREGGNWLGTSILRPAYKNWLIKDRLLRVQAQTIERNGMGIPLYKAQEGASPDDMAAGLAMAKAWRAGEAAGSAVPHDADLLLRGVEGDLPDAEPAIRYHDEQIARAVLAHFLNLGTQTGSWALGTTFADFFTMSLQTLAEQIRDTATSHIVEDLVDVNFGEGEPAPRLVFDEIGSRQAATAQALKTLVDAGVIHPDQVLEESSRQQYGLPPADPATATTPPAPSGSTPQAPTQMGDMSVAAAMAGPKGGAAEAADLDEAADDWEDAIDALIQALAELDGRVEAAWDPARHPRNPKGSPGGGRFRSMVDRLKDAITEHQKGGGKGHPFDGFDREQLRRVAKARGIELKRGEDRDSIAKKLLDHLDQPSAHPSAGRPGIGKDRIGWVRDHDAELQAALDDTEAGDGALARILAEQGFDSLPQVVNTLPAGAQPLFRGVDPGMARWDTGGLSGAAMNEQFRTGDLFPGVGLYGNGTYFSVDHRVAEVYAGMHEDRLATDVPSGVPVKSPNILVAALRPDARVIDYDDLLAQQPAETFKDRSDVLTDPGRYAAAKGYDAIRIDGRTDGSDIPDASGHDHFTQYAVLNRGALLVVR